MHYFLAGTIPALFRRQARQGKAEKFELMGIGGLLA